MPSTLDPGDRKILIIAGSILLLLILATIAFAPPANDAEGQGVPSTYSTANNGAQAAYLLLQESRLPLGTLGEISYRIARESGGRHPHPCGPVQFPGES